MATLTVDGSSVGAVTSYTFSKVTANHAISASFAATTFTITASAGSGGSISPTAASSIGYGGSKVFSITPKPNYLISAIKVDGVSVGTKASYTFSKVTANHTINASFVYK